MQLRDLDALLVSLLSQDHPEIVSAEVINNDHVHSRVRVCFASGAVSSILVRSVEGPKVPAHKGYDIPTEVI
ncbi:hypothetical protein [Actinokineospora sp.]|uniref:hypothetical protein n=1 Tax=Actinokineospora sp. TaxID=1872133 RepID=UPI003D6C327A